MEELDKRLQDIGFSTDYVCGDCGAPHNWEEVAKKAFTHAGGGTRLMTGQEWYDRLAKKLDGYAWTADEKDSILQAAFEVSHEAAK